jgi:hypothetical protein
MSFWKTTEGNAAAMRSASFDAGGGSMEPIPDNTNALAMVDEAKWDRRNDGLEYISLRWTVVAPLPYANRKVFQKLWVSDADPSAKDPDKKRDKALRMLAAIDTNAGGRLTQIDRRPSDTELATALSGKPMMIKVMTWSLEDNQTGEKKSGNWIAAVSPKTGEVQSPPPVRERVVVSSADGLDIPF